MDIYYWFIDNNFTGSKKEREHNAGIWLVKYVAEKFYAIKNCDLEIINQKPQFKHSDLQFSISHSHNMAAVCFDENPVGFDIEFIKPRNYIPIAKRMNFKLKKNTLEEFYEFWTRYEAKYKLQNNAQYIETGKIDNYIFSIASSKKQEVLRQIHCLHFL